MTDQPSTKKNILILYDHHEIHVKTIADYLASFHRFSRHNVRRQPPRASASGGQGYVRWEERESLRQRKSSVIATTINATVRPIQMP